MSSQNFMLPTPIFIVEDDFLMQQRLRSLLMDLGYSELDLLFAQSIKQAREVLDEHPVSICLVDLGLPDGNGKDLIASIREQYVDIPILVISAWSTQEAILGAIQAGATGYLLKERDNFELTLSIRSVIRGGAPIDPFIAQQILSKLVVQHEEKMPQLEQQNILSPRELNILQFVSQGMSNREIADHLNLSRYTVECHIKNIYRKLSVTNRSKAVHAARDLGLLP